MKTAKPTHAAEIRIFPRYRMYRSDFVVLGPGKAELLTLVAETGSIAEAARRMSMSYMRAWLHIKVMNKNFAEPVVESARGGSARGGAVLTDMGKKVLSLWDRLQREAHAATKNTCTDLTKLLAKP